jgi:hypothetical protein
MHPGPLSGIDDARCEDKEVFDIFDRIEKGFYNPTRRRPNRPEKPRLPMSHNSTMASLYARKLEEYELKMAHYEEEVSSYHKEIAEKRNLFKKDAIEYCGLTGHRKADLAFNKAHEDEHDSGLAAVVQELEELSDLIL